MALDECTRRLAYGRLRRSLSPEIMSKLGKQIPQNHGHSIFIHIPDADNVPEVLHAIHQTELGTATVNAPKVTSDQVQQDQDFKKKRAREED